MSEKIKGLKDLEQVLECFLQAELQLIVPLRVHCVVRENTVSIAIHVCESSNLSPALVFPLVKQKMTWEKMLLDYPLQTYLIVHEKSRFEANQSLVLVPRTTTYLAPQLENALALALRGEKQLSGPIIGLLLAFGVSLATIYALTRPCVWGNCANLERARALTEQAIHSIAITSSDTDVKAARHYLSQSLALLQAIPPWSNYHPKATTLIDRYQDRDRDLAYLDTSLETASKAVALARKAPLTLDRWQETQQLWYNALSPLGQIPSNSPFYPFSRLKIVQYQKNLREIEQRIEQERLAIKNLEIAHKYAQIAISHQNTAQSLSDWQLIEKTWQAAVTHLQAITSDTTVAPEVTQQLETYLSRWAMARANREREELGLKYFNHSIELAKQAEKAAKNTQWSESVDLWKNGLVSLQQIPPNTFQSQPAKPLIAVYKTSLQKAETQLTLVEQSAQIKQNLAQICLKTTKICTYELSDTLIRIYLTVNYTQKVRQTALQAQAQTNLKTQLDLLNHIARLESTFQSLSKNTRRTVEVYNAERVLMAVYEPQ